MRAPGHLRHLVVAVVIVAAVAGPADADSMNGPAAMGNAAATTVSDPAAKAPPPSHTIIPIQTFQYDAYATGFANIAKMGGSAMLGEPAPAAPDESVTTFVTYELPADLTTCAAGGPECSALDYAAGSLTYDGKPELPPVTESFLAYGLLPVTATLTLSQVGMSDCAAPGQTPYLAPMCVYNDIHEGTGSGQVTIATSRAMASVSDLKVNGVPLRMHPGCQSRPFTLTLTGSSVSVDFPAPPALPLPGEYSLSNGGLLTGTADIPSFAGCVAADGENLAPLLDSDISGPGNYLQITQGDLCLPVASFDCPPTADPPVHSAPEVSIIGDDDSTQTTTTCGKVAHPTVLDGAEGYTDVGTVESFSVSDCTATPAPGSGGNTESCSIAGKGLPWPVTATSYDPDMRIAAAAINSADLAGQCTVRGGGSCTFDMTGSIDVLYDYADSMLADLATPLTTTASTCADFPTGVTTDNLFIPQYTVPASGASQ